MKLLDSGGAQEASPPFFFSSLPQFPEATHVLHPGLILWTKQFLKILEFLETFHEIKYSTYTPPAYTTPPTATQILTPASKGRRVRRPFLTICSERNNNLLGKRSYLPLVLKSYRPPSSSLASFWPVYIQFVPKHLCIWQWCCVNYQTARLVRVYHNSCTHFNFFFRVFTIAVNYSFRFNSLRHVSKSVDLYCVLSVLFARSQRSFVATPSKGAREKLGWSVFANDFGCFLE